MQTNFLPGPTSVHFDDIAKERIYAAIDKKKALADLDDLKNAYRDMACRLGRQPMMMDFVRFGDKDPMLFIAKKESFYEFSQYMEPQPSTLNDAHRAVLKLMSLELSNGKRIEEILILRHLLAESSWSTADLAAETERWYGFLPSTETMDHAARVLSLQFFGKRRSRNTEACPSFLLNGRSIGRRRILNP